MFLNDWVAIDYTRCPKAHYVSSCLLYAHYVDSMTLTALVRLQRSRQDVYDIIQTARKLCIRPSLSFLNSCMRALGDHKDIHGACTVMDSIMALDNMDPDVISYNSLIFALVQHPWASKVLDLSWISSAVPLNGLILILKDLRLSRPSNMTSTMT